MPVESIYIDSDWLQIPGASLQSVPGEPSWDGAQYDTGGGVQEWTRQTHGEVTNQFPGIAYVFVLFSENCFLQENLC